jgi:hypothetical protein
VELGDAAVGTDCAGLEGADFAALVGTGVLVCSAAGFFWSLRLADEEEPWLAIEALEEPFARDREDATGVL